MEAIFLDCGAGGPQLKRNPLGGRLVRSTWLVSQFAIAHTESQASMPSGWRLGFVGTCRPKWTWSVAITGSSRYSWTGSSSSMAAHSHFWASSRLARTCSKLFGAAFLPEGLRTVGVGRLTCA